MPRKQGTFMARFATTPYVPRSVASVSGASSWTANDALASIFSSDDDQHASCSTVLSVRSRTRCVRRNVDKSSVTKRLMTAVTMWRRGCSARPAPATKSEMVM